MNFTSLAGNGPLPTTHIPEHQVAALMIACSFFSIGALINFLSRRGSRVKLHRSRRGSWGKFCPALPLLPRRISDGFSMTQFCPLLVFKAAKQTRTVFARLTLSLAPCRQGLEKLITLSTALLIIRYRILI